jgi:U2 small nuclear ribonucleoprotein B''
MYRLMESPNHTIFVTNLTDRIRADKLKILLFELFSQFGEVIDIRVAKGTDKTGKPLRGTAFVTYGSIQSSSVAMKMLKKFNFLKKEIKLNYSRDKNHEILKLTNQYKPTFKPERKLRMDLD